MNCCMIGISEDPQFTADEIEVADILICFQHYSKGLKHSMIGISEDSQFTADEIEVADILICFQHYSKGLNQWEAMPRLSTIQRKESSATCNDESQNDYEHQHGGMAMVPQPERHLSLTSRPNSKMVRANNRPGKRAPKRKTHKELTETVDELSVENAQLLKEVEQSKKTCQDLKHCNVHLKSQLALCLEQRQEQNMPDISQPLSSSHSDTIQKTITMASCDNLQSYENENFEKFSTNSTLDSAYDKSHRLGRPMYPSSPESSFVSEKDGALPAKDTVRSGSLDPNALDETLFVTNISNNLHGQMLMSKNKVAAEGRRHRVELKRGKYSQLSRG